MYDSVFTKQAHIEDNRLTLPKNVGM